jgi:hypothetical protein
MEIVRNGMQPAVNGPAEWFTGNVRIDSQFRRDDPSRVTGAIVTFEPGHAPRGTPIRSAKP